MATINDLAREFGAQPHEVAAFADLGTYGQADDLPIEVESMIRGAWGIAPAAMIDPIAENRMIDQADDLLRDIASEYEVYTTDQIIFGE